MLKTKLQKNKNKGFTLLELVVALGIFSILVLFAVDLFINMSRFYAGSLSNKSTQQNIKLAMETITRYSKQALTADWNATDEILELKTRDSEGNNYWVVFQRAETSPGSGSHGIKMAINDAEGGPATQFLTSENVNIDEFKVSYAVGVPVIISINISAEIDDYDKNIERGVSGENKIEMQTSVAIKGQYNY